MSPRNADGSAAGSTRRSRACSTIASSSWGPRCVELEVALAAFCGARHAISCASGTDALLLVLMAKGIGPGDAVFCPSFTFCATAEVAALLGATPVFCDVDDATFNHRPRQSAAGRSPPRKRHGLTPKAVIPVDLFGLPADHDAVAAIAAAEAPVHARRRRAGLRRHLSRAARSAHSARHRDQLFPGQAARVQNGLASRSQHLELRVVLELRHAARRDAREASTSPASRAATCAAGSAMKRNVTFLTFAADGLR